MMAQYVNDVKEFLEFREAMYRHYEQYISKEILRRVKENIDDLVEGVE